MIRELSFAGQWTEGREGHFDSSNTKFDAFLRRTTSVSRKMAPTIQLCLYGKGSIANKKRRFNFCKSRTLLMTFRERTALKQLQGAIGEPGGNRERKNNVVKAYSSLDGRFSLRQKAFSGPDHWQCAMVV